MKDITPTQIKFYTGIALMIAAIVVANIFPSLWLPSLISLGIGYLFTVWARKGDSST